MYYSPVRHSLYFYNAFDLHVLGTPPAFILSQDQTLHCFLISSSFDSFLLSISLAFACFFLFIDVSFCSVFNVLFSALFLTACLYYHLFFPFATTFLSFFNFSFSSTFLLSFFLSLLSLFPFSFLLCSRISFTFSFSTINLSYFPTSLLSYPTLITTSSIIPLSLHLFYYSFLHFLIYPFSFILTSFLYYFIISYYPLLQKTL